MARRPLCAAGSLVFSRGLSTTPMMSPALAMIVATATMSASGSSQT